MGCDIWAYAEKLTPDGWVEVFREPDAFEKEFNYKTNEIKFYKGRNYILFAVLADVRNNWNITPISKPKGMPGKGNKCSPTVRKKRKALGTDAHSMSWLTLKELLGNQCPHIDCHKIPGMAAECPNRDPNGYNWDAVVKYTDYQFVDGRAAEIMGQKNLRDLTNIFHEQTIPALLKIAEDDCGGDVTKVRIVFWFDN